MKQLVSEIAALVAQGQSFALATVISRSGSAPRSAGAKMLVHADGTALGTVGGGILEAQVQQLAGEVLRERSSRVRGFAFSGKDAATMDAICGGQVEVLVEWLDASDPHLVEVFQELASAAANHQQAWLVSGLPGGPAAPHHLLVRADGSVVGSQPGAAGPDPDRILSARQPACLDAGGQSWLVEPLDIAGTAYIFGAGHVSRSLAEFTRAVGFWTVVLDDRPEYANPERFPYADQRIVLDTFDRALEGIVVDRDSFLVIVTRGHLHDRTVLAQALQTGAGYIGMIGSRRKCGLIFDELRREGFSAEDLARVHAPIGLPIGAETPEEIGISIVAEMIQVRAAINPI
jgi:xanthine dehydrogenase accessory factor